MTKKAKIDWWWASRKKQKILIKCMIKCFPIVEYVLMSYSVSYFLQVREPLFALQAWWRRHGFAERIQKEGIQEQALWGPVSLKGSGSAHRPFLLQRGLWVRVGACVCGCAGWAWRSRSLTGALLRGEDMRRASFWLKNVFLHLEWRRRC